VTVDLIFVEYVMSYTWLFDFIVSISLLICICVEDCRRVCATQDGNDAFSSRFSNLKLLFCMRP